MKVELALFSKPFESMFKKEIEKADSYSELEFSDMLNGVRFLLGSSPRGDLQASNLVVVESADLYPVVRGFKKNFFKSFCRVAGILESDFLMTSLNLDEFHEVRGPVILLRSLILRMPNLKKIYVLGKTPARFLLNLELVSSKVFYSYETVVKDKIFQVLIYPSYFSYVKYSGL